MLSGFVVNCGVSLLRTSSDYEVGRIMKTTLEGFRLAGFFYLSSSRKVYVSIRKIYVITRKVFLTTRYDP